MNWNGQREYLQHLIQRRYEPDKSVQLQADLDAKRRSKILSSTVTRPVYLPLKFNMNALGQISPYRDVTDQLSYDVIITGIKADTQTREIIIRRTEDEKPTVYVGEELNLHLRLDEVAGQTTSPGGGQLGVFYLPSPILLPAGNRLTIEMLKTENTDDPEQANIVLIGVRVYKKEYGELLLDAAERQMIDFHISAREIPRVVFLKQMVDFDVAGVGGVARSLRTPEAAEPLLIRGIRTSLRHSNIELRIQGEPNWTVRPTPIWAVASEDDLSHDNFIWFSKPIYLHSKNSIEIDRVTNSIDGETFDPQTGNTITWICETV